MGVADLLKTGARMWVAPTGETRPDDTSVAYGASWGGNWTQVGLTNAPLKMNYTTEVYLFGVEEYTASVKSQIKSEDLVLETVLAEITADNIALAQGTGETVTDEVAGASQKPNDSVSIGGEWVLEQKAVGFEGMYVDTSGTKQPIRVFINVATLMFNGELEFSFKTDNAVGIPVKVQALADTASSGRLYTLQRVTGPVSA